MKKTYDQQNWNRDLQRIIRRGAIRRGIKKSNSLNEIIDATRKFEDQFEVKKRTKKLINEDFSIDEEKRNVARRLREHLVAGGVERRGFAIVILGSAIHGGNMVRKLVMGKKNYFDPNSDIDLGILADEMDASFANDITEKAMLFFRNEKRFKLCLYMNPSKLKSSNIGSVKDAIEILNQVNKIGSVTKFDPLLLFFEPSIPPEINQNNRSLILEALSIIYQKDKRKWSNICRSILSGWKEIHYIEYKHIQDPTYSNNRIDDVIKAKVVRYSNRHMLIAMENLLMSTKVKRNLRSRIKSSFRGIFSF